MRGFWLPSETQELFHHFNTLAKKKKNQTICLASRLFTASESHLFLHKIHISFSFSFEARNFSHLNFLRLWLFESCKEEEVEKKEGKEKK